MCSDLYYLSWKDNLPMAGNLIRNGPVNMCAQVRSINALTALVFVFEKM